MKIIKRFPFRPRYYILRPWEFFSACGRRIRWAKQRVERGFADCDLWAIDDWLLEMLPQAIHLFRERTHGYPGHITEEKWQEVLKQMEEAFTAAAKEVEFDGNECEWNEKERRLKEGLDLMGEYFFYLWDQGSKASLFVYAEQVFFS